MIISGGALLGGTGRSCRRLYRELQGVACAFDEPPRDDIQPLKGRKDGRHGQDRLRFQGEELERGIASDSPIESGGKPVDHGEAFPALRERNRDVMRVRADANIERYAFLLAPSVDQAPQRLGLVDADEREAREVREKYLAALHDLQRLWKRTDDRRFADFDDSQTGCHICAVRKAEIEARAQLPVRPEHISRMLGGYFDRGGLDLLVEERDGVGQQLERQRRRRRYPDVPCIIAAESAFELVDGVERGIGVFHFLEKRPRLVGRTEAAANAI